MHVLIIGAPKTFATSSDLCDLCVKLVCRYAVTPQERVLPQFLDDPKDG